MVKRKKEMKCACDCHSAELVAVEEPAPPKAKGTGKKSAKGKSPAQVKHQARFGLVAKLKKSSPEMTNEQRWAKAHQEIH